MNAISLLLALLAPISSLDGDTSRPDPMAVAEDDCAKATIDVELDVAGGHVRVFDGTTWVAVDGPIPVYTGALSHVTLQLHYTEDEWVTALRADGGVPSKRTTSGGDVRHTLRADVERVTISSVWAGSRVAAAAMTPVVPDVIIRPIKVCPPSP